MSLSQTLRSSIGAKAVMAVTGVGLLLFVLAHMLGNLQVFLGPDALNTYAAKLKGLGPLLWIMRLGLLGIFVAHVGAAIAVTRRNRAARPVAYAHPGDVAVSYAAKTMVFSGFVVLAFVIYHLLHFTVGVTHPEHFAMHEALPDGTERHDVYGMVIAGFSRPLVAWSYVLANIVLGMHISHGASSLFQTLGLRGKAGDWTEKVGPALAVVIVLGNVAMPLAILLGYGQGAL